jgi:hypothetical protein
MGNACIINVHCWAATRAFFDRIVLTFSIIHPSTLQSVLTLTSKTIHTLQSCSSWSHPLILIYAWP